MQLATTSSVHTIPAIFRPLFFGFIELLLSVDLLDVIFSIAAKKDSNAIVLQKEELCIGEEGEGWLTLEKEKNHRCKDVKKVI